MHQQYIRMLPGSKMGILLIHGIVGTPDHFHPFLELIPEKWSVCNLLLEGHGGTVKDFAAASMEKWQAQVASRLEALLQCSERVVIVGHSMGCLFAIRAARKYPRRISRLFLLNAPFRLRITPSTALQTLRIALGKVRPRDTVALAMMRDGGVALETGLWKYASWTPRFLELLRQMRETEKLLPGLTVPAEAFHSCHDALVSEKSCHIMETKAGIRCTRLPHSDHFHYESEDLLLLRSRLKQLIEEQDAP